MKVGPEVSPSTGVVLSPPIVPPVLWTGRLQVLWLEAGTAQAPHTSKAPGLLIAAMYSGQRIPRCSDKSQEDKYL